MPFAPGDRVHFVGLGTGTVREARSGGRYAIEIKGRIVVAAERDLEPADGSRLRRTRDTARPADREGPPSDGSGPTLDSTALRPGELRPSERQIDLHGKTVEEAIAAVETFLNDALLDGCAGVCIVHGRSGGRLKAAVHGVLRTMTAVKGFRVDARNPGVTIVYL